MRRAFALILLAALFAIPAFTPARAADDLYTVKDIPVDATAAASSEAQTIAINSGRARAFDILFKRLAKQQDWGKKPALDDITLQRLVGSYTVAGEKRSTTRYLGKVTYKFNPDAVRRLFRSKSLAYADMLASKPVLVIPMAPNYAVHGGWTSMMAANKAAGAASLVVPLGDAIDASMLGGIDFNTVSWQDLEPVASRLQANEAYLALAVQSPGRITVKLRRVAPEKDKGAPAPIPDVVLNVPAGTAPQKAFGDAARAAAAAIGNAWKSHAAIDFGQRSRLTADIQIDSLAKWGETLQKLATVPVVTEVNVVAMNLGEARISLVYAGTAEQLRGALLQAHFSLDARSGGGWALNPVEQPVTP